MQELCSGSLWSLPGCMLTSAVAPLAGDGKTAEWGSLRSLPFRSFPVLTRPINTVALCLCGTWVSCLGKTHVHVTGTMEHHWIGWLSKWHFKNGLHSVSCCIRYHVECATLNSFSEQISTSRSTTKVDSTPSSKHLPGWAVLHFGFCSHRASRPLSSILTFTQTLKSVSKIYSLIYYLLAYCSQSHVRWPQGTTRSKHVSVLSGYDCDKLYICFLHSVLSMNLSQLGVLGPAALCCCLTENLFKVIKGKCMNNLHSCQYCVALGGPQKYYSTKQKDTRIRLEQQRCSMEGTTHPQWLGHKNLSYQGSHKTETRKWAAWYSKQPQIRITNNPKDSVLCCCLVLLYHTSLSSTYRQLQS